MVARSGSARSRRYRWVAALAFSLIAAMAPAGPAGASAATDSRPNIILISADDMRADDIWVMDNLRGWLTEQGTTFANSYSPFPFCCPARASIVTGQYAHNHGVLDNAAPLGGYAALDGSSTLATWLQDSGYLTSFVGKYLNNYGSVRPVTVPPGWDDWHANVGGGDYFDTRIFENGTPIQYTGPYQTDLHADIATEAITRSAAGDAPFFLWASFYAPHGGTPVEADDPPGNNTPAVAPRHRDVFKDLPLPRGPNFDEADVSDKPTHVSSRQRLTASVQNNLRETYQQRLESLLALDEAINKMMEALQATGELDNTIIAFTSDNGYMLGEHRLQAGKKVPYEASAQVPLVIRGPGFPVGQTREQLVANIDLAPTFVDAANTQAGLDVDGMSLLPLASDPANRPQRALVVEAGPEIVDGPWFYTGIRTDRWLYVDYEAAGEIEMYDMVNDRFQLQSLHADPAYDEQRMLLAARLDVLRNCAGAACRDDEVPPPNVTPPVVTEQAPASDATAVQLTVNVLARFSEPVTGVSGTSFTLSSPAGTAIPAAVTYNATNRVAILNPTSNLETDTQYTATLNGGVRTIRDAAGDPLATTEWTFLTGPAPKTTAKAPMSGAINVSRTANVTATFSEPVNGVSIASFTLTNATTGPITGIVSRSGTTNKWILDPSQALAANTSYTVTLTGAITDIVGNPLMTTTWTFTTRA